jgi:basic amino acid/polyamine antiporter, APA family
MSERLRTAPDKGDGEGPRLVPRLGLLSATLLSLGAMIGSGVFVAFGEATQSSGAALPLAVIAAAIVAACNGLSAAELGAAYPRAGGAYEFAYRLLHPAVGFAAGSIFILAGITASATYALTFANYLQIIIPFPPRLIGVGLVILAVIVNILGVRLSYSLNNVLVVIKIVILVAFVAIAAVSFRPANFAPFLPADLSGLVQASALLFFAYTGYARSVTVAEEIKNPARNIPWAVGLSLTLTLALYLAVSVSAIGLAGPQILGSSPAPLAEAMSFSGAAFGPALMALGAVIATASVLLTEIWGFSRLVFAMARRGDLPGLLARMSKGGGVPYVAVLLTGVILILLTLFVDLRSLLATSSFALLIYYLVMNACALRLSPGSRLFPRAVSVAGLILSLALAFSLPLGSVAVVIAMGALAVLYHLVVRRG